MYIVTGAVGFIGTCLVRELNDRGIENILIVDRLDKSSKWKNFQEMKFFDYVDADSFLEMLYDFPDELADKVQGVFHLGACSSTTEMDMNFLMENNVNYSKAVFEFFALLIRFPFICVLCSDLW